jgi:hypothetical protein
VLNTSIPVSPYVFYQSAPLGGAAALGVVVPPLSPFEVGQASSFLRANDTVNTGGKRIDVWDNYSFLFFEPDSLLILEQERMPAELRCK